MAYKVGVDLGGTKMLLALAGENGEIIQSRKLPTRAEKGPERIFKDLVAGITELFRVSPGVVDGLGFCMAGYYDRQSGMMVDSPNLPGWEDYPVRQELNRLIGLPMIVENDANAAAWGEFVYGAGKGKNNIFLVTVGTGIGGALIIEGRLVRGARGFAGEIGHIPLLPWEGPIVAAERVVWKLWPGTAIAEGRALVQTGK